MTRVRIERLLPLLLFTAAPAVAGCAAEAANCVAFGDGGSASFGAALRVRTMDYRPLRFGIGADGDAYTLYRGLLHADLRWGEHWQGYGELGAHDEIGRRGGPAGTDRSGPDAHQLYVGWRSGGNALRAGRQEMSYGSSRLVSVRDGPNIRLSFDGVRATRFVAAGRIDAFATRPVDTETGSFDDTPDHGQALWGVYAALAPKAAAPHKFDLYWLGYERDAARFAIGTEREYRQSFGLRWYGSAGGWDWNTEVVHQRGRFGSRTVRAWTLASDTGYTFAAARGSPRIGMKADIASGDGKPHDDRLGTFNALYPNASYFSESSLLAPANLIDVQPALTLAPSATVQLILGWDFVWKQRRQDAVYTTPTPLLAVPGTAGTPRRVGDQLKLEARWQLGPQWETRLQLSRFNVGPALRQAGGRDTDFLSTTVAFRW